MQARGGSLEEVLSLCHAPSSPGYCWMRQQPGNWADERVATAAAAHCHHTGHCVQKLCLVLERRIGRKKEIQFISLPPSVPPKSQN